MHHHLLDENDTTAYLEILAPASAQWPSPHLLARNSPVRCRCIHLRFYPFVEASTGASVVLSDRILGHVRPQSRRVTYIVSALFVRKLTRVIFPARGPSAVSNGVVTGQIASPISLWSVKHISHPRQALLVDLEERQESRTKASLNLLAVVQITLEYHQATLCKIINQLRGYDRQILICILLRPEIVVTYLT